LQTNPKANLYIVECVSHSFYSILGKEAHPEVWGDEIMLEQTFHTGDDYYDIEVAICNGHFDYARERLRDIIQAGADAEAWYLAALVAHTPAQRISLLEKALALNPDHNRARLALEDARRSSTPASESQSLLARLQHLFRRSMA